MKLTVLNNVAVKDGLFLLELCAPGALERAVPGQFLHVRVEDSCDPLLRRPLSIYDAVFPRRGRGIVRVLYEVAGKGTALLATRKPGTEVDALGPLGNGFPVETLEDFSKIFIVAGGIGVAPLFYLAKKLAHKKPVVLLGAQTKGRLACEKEFKKIGCAVRVATDDGSKGFKGRVTGLLKEMIPSAAQARGAAVCACGPKPMLAAVADVALQAACPAWVSLEEFMGCGVGACLGCVLPTTSGYQRICREGPVFDARQVVWDDRKAV